MSSTQTQAPSMLAATGGRPPTPGGNPPSGGGGGGGGGGQGAGAGAGAGGGGGSKLLGAEPRDFSGDRLDVDRFLSDLQGYISLNGNNPLLASFKTHIHLSLSFITGAQVCQWKDRMRVWVEDPAIDDNHNTWDQFLDQFRAQYADTQKGERARMTLERFAMKGLDVDQYISDFIDLANDAKYHLEAEGTKRMFAKGLGRFIGIETAR